MVFFLPSCSILNKTPKQDVVIWDIEWQDERNAKVIRKEDVRIQDTNLAQYYESWLGTPHQIGGISKQGVDCSGFVYNVYRDVYGIKLPRSAHEMSKVVTKINQTNLQEGDLVFFGKTRQKANHVGIYLKDNTFVHTSSSRGVIISSLDDKYWSKLFYLAARHPKRD